MPGRVSRSALWMREQAAFLLVCVGVAVGLALVAPSVWTGVLVVAISLLAATALRIVLPARHAGLLVVRGRWLDATLLFALGITVLAVDLRLRG